MPAGDLRVTGHLGGPGVGGPDQRDEPASLAGERAGRACVVYPHLLRSRHWGRYWRGPATGPGTDALRHAPGEHQVVFTRIERLARGGDGPQRAVEPVRLRYARLRAVPSHRLQLRVAQGRAVRIGAV